MNNVYSLNPRDQERWRLIVVSHLRQWLVNLLVGSASKPQGTKQTLLQTSSTKGIKRSTTGTAAHREALCVLTFNPVAWDPNSIGSGPIFSAPHPEHMQYMYPPAMHSLESSFCPWKRHQKDLSRSYSSNVKMKQEKKSSKNSEI